MGLKSSEDAASAWIEAYDRLIPKISFVNLSVWRNCVGEIEIDSIYGYKLPVMEIISIKISNIVTREKVFRIATSFGDGGVVMC